MPLFSYSSFDQAVEKATSEMNTSEDWSTILEICDKVQVTANGSKDCLRSIIKRLNSSVPLHAMHALTLLDACVKNCGRKFHLEVCSRDFENEIKKLLHKKGHPKVVQKLTSLLKKWSNEDFKSDPELSLIPSLYNSIKDESLPDVQTSKPSSQRSKDKSEKQEEEDLAKAIKLSLKEASTKTTSSSLYPIASVSLSKEPRKVRAIYDFDAAEDNELSFKAGEVILVLDDSDPNWFRGSNHRGQGLFPANFVSFDLNADCTPEITKTEKKTVKFDEEVKVKTLETSMEAVVIDEEKINSLLHLLNDADPTGGPDPDELLALEDHCGAMGELINQELEEIDRRHASLNSASELLCGALNSYQTLMKDYPGFSPPYSHYQIPEVGCPPMQGYDQHPSAAQHVHTHVYAGSVPPHTPYVPGAEQYQPMSLPANRTLPTALQSRMMQSGPPPSHVPYSTSNPNSYPNIPQSSVAATSGTFSVSHPSREANGLYYGDMVANSVQSSSTPISMQHQPML